LNQIHSNSKFKQIWADFNSNQNGFEFPLNKSKEKMEKPTIHPGFHCSPWPQWSSGPKPSWLAQGSGLWTAHAPSACPACSHRTARNQRATWCGTHRHDGGSMTTRSF
jgi:hypothetical protein